MARWSVSQPRGIGARGHCAPPPIGILHRQRPGRTRLSPLDRLLWIWLYRVWPRCLNIMVLVKPATVVRWHRQGFRLYWRWRSRSGRPSIGREVRDLIRQINSANPLCAPRIHGELLKLGRPHNHQHRQLPLLFTPHLPLPPPIRLATQTNYIAMTFRRLSTACWKRSALQYSLHRINLGAETRLGRPQVRGIEFKPSIETTAKKDEKRTPSLWTKTNTSPTRLRMDHCSDSPGDTPASARAYLAGVPRASAAQQTTNHHRSRGSSGQEPGKRYREGRPGRV